MVPKGELSTGKIDVNAPAADVNRDVNRGKLVSTSSRKVDVNRKLIFDVNCYRVAPALCTSTRKMERRRPAVECQQPGPDFALLTSRIPNHTVAVALPVGDVATLLRRCRHQEP